MKKILFTFLFSSIALSQVMESEEPLLKPLKAKKIMSNESITSDDSGTIIFDNEKSKITWIGGLKYGLSNHDGNMKMMSGNLMISKDIKLSGSVVINMQSMTNNDLPTGAKDRLIGHLKSADFFNVMSMVKDRLGANPLPVVIPIGSGEMFTGIIDLISMKAILYNESTMGSRFDEANIPDDMAELADKWRKNLIEETASYDENLLEKFVSDIEISDSELRSAIRKGCLDNTFIPLLCFI